jgi:DNA-directed RNA polymerase specialized sigma24 family protein
MTAELTRLLRADEGRRRAEEHFRAALLAACDALGYVRVAEALGVSRQAVRQLAERARR